LPLPSPPPSQHPIAITIVIAGIIVIACGMIIATTIIINSPS
jgi:hypothetical protein